MIYLARGLDASNLVSYKVDRGSLWASPTEWMYYFPVTVYGQPRNEKAFGQRSNSFHCVSSFTDVVQMLAYGLPWKPIWDIFRVSTAVEIRAGQRDEATNKQHVYQEVHLIDLPVRY